MEVLLKSRLFLFWWICIGIENRKIFPSISLEFGSWFRCFSETSDQNWIKGISPNHLLIVASHYCFRFSSLFSFLSKFMKCPQPRSQTNYLSIKFYNRYFILFLNLSLYFYRVRVILVFFFVLGDFTWKLDKAY